MRREHEEKERERAPRQQPVERQQPTPVWENTRPRGNPEPEPSDVGRSREKWEAVLGR